VAALGEVDAVAVAVERGGVLGQEECLRGIVEGDAVAGGGIG